MANWDNIQSEGSVEDRRGMAPVASGLGAAGIGIIVLFTLLSGGNLGDVLNVLVDSGVTQTSSQSLDSSDFEGKDEYEVFTSKVLGSTNDMWSQKFQENGKLYSPPKLILFRVSTNSACGGATSDVGPHYCPLDETIYLDETFFDELTNQLGAKGGDVAQAYVIAHEAGHHAQKLLGTMDKIQSEASSNPLQENELSVKLELQADCYAGLWANSLKDQNIFEPGEISEAQDAAAAVGDDRIQETVNGRINPETWTHGSSNQRTNAFNTGYEKGTLSSCQIN